MNNLSVLYAEDDLAHLALTRRMFSNAVYDCHVTHFYNGKELIDHLNSVVASDGTVALNNTILLLDLKMPIMNGIETLQILKSDSRFKHLPVIIFTTSANRADIDQCQALGCNGYFEKSFNFVQAKKLWAIMHEALEQMNNHSSSSTQKAVIDIVTKTDGENDSQ